METDRRGRQASTKAGPLGRDTARISWCNMPSSLSLYPSTGVAWSSRISCGSWPGDPSGYHEHGEQLMELLLFLMTCEMSQSGTISVGINLEWRMKGSRWTPHDYLNYAWGRLDIPMTRTPSPCRNEFCSLRVSIPPRLSLSFRSSVCVSLNCRDASQAHYSPNPMWVGMLKEELLIGQCCSACCWAGAALGCASACFITTACARASAWSAKSLSHVKHLFSPTSASLGGGQRATTTVQNGLVCFFSF